MVVSRKLQLEWFLQTTHLAKPYWEAVDAKVKALGGDGCTGVPDFRKKFCDEHDCHYRTHKFIIGQAITFDEANYIFRRRHQIDSWFGRWSPMGWWRWLAVQYGGQVAWQTYGGTKR